MRLNEHWIRETAAYLIKLTFFVIQGTPVKDVTIAPTAPKTLLLDKHVKYIEAYGAKKEDYVSTKTALLCANITVNV